MDRCRARTPLVPLIVSATAAVTLLAGCSGDGGSGAGTGPGRSAGAGRTASGAANALEDDYLRVVEDVLPSVVQINAREGVGSGVVYDREGHVVTNAHVVGDSTAFQVTLAVGEDTIGARLVRAYPQQDLAVVKLDRVPKGLRPAAFGDSAEVEVGQIVMAMGNPLGLSSSVTQGIVSAVGRTVTQSADSGGTGTTLANMVQTSAAINPGNSGGALVNLDGEVIGIPTLAATDPGLGGGQAAGIGFAIPSSTVRNIAGQIIETGEVTESGRAALGVTARTVVDDDFRPSGVAVVEVQEGGAAQRAGLRSGDVVTAIGDTAIRTLHDLSEALAAHRPGERVELTYERNGDERTVEVTLGEL
ncbi:S1C family serine protease [Streptomyces sp. GC420]|uniref:S1C family serine protease n=1 Tax=Streptomyces sp. GC420 TaxID=2697568 RepID=UPI00141517B6|nr:trypsin-like peptidase domain-containing protein [Streptomyces sp. GC420]NBM15016.1 PDZ domain-containing protein [Streptomyces sp. GC420]